MGGSKGGDTQTVTQKSDPWAKAEPYLLDVLGQAQAAYNQGQEYYPFATWIPYSPQTQAGLQQLTDFALGPQGQALTGAASDAALQALTGAGNSPTMPFYQNLMGGSQSNQFGGALNTYVQAFNEDLGDNPISQFLNPMASGAFAGLSPSQFAMPMASGALNGMDPAYSLFGNMATGNDVLSNPWLDATFNRGAEAVEDRVNSQFSLAGRYGSGIHQDIMQQGLGDLATDIYGGAYENERGRQMQAAGAIQDAYGQGLNRQLQGINQAQTGFDSELARQMQAAGAIQSGFEGSQARRMQGAEGYGATQQQIIANMMGGAEGLQGAYSGGMQDLIRAMAVAPEAYKFATAPGETLMQVGGAYEQQAAQQLQDLMNRWMFEQESPWANLMNYSGLAASMGGMGGMTTQTSPFNGPSPFQNILSGGSAGLGLASALGMGGPWGAGLGVLGSVLGGLFG